ncbi:MAG: hypothetical protein M1833_001152 [Piccolia ochrophora]|nr:MAG: hypothetical protein M1833_001152 [Piccolia ochrophora]
MIRAHSSPGIDEAGHVLMSTVSTRPLSPPGQYHRYHSPSRRSAEEGSPHATKYSLAGIGETVYEEAELEENPHMDDTHFMHNSPAMATNPGNTFPRRHRPSSPLTNITQQRAHTTASPSAVVALTRFNEGFPGSSSNSISFSSNSSVASTPTSTRSRSPSISSLETIPDSPAAEEAALEAERIATLKAIAEAAEGEDAATGREAGRRSSLEVPGSGGRGRNIVVGPGGSGSSYGSRDKRKRWSVCGAERRGDLDLETIWED